MTVQKMQMTWIRVLLSLKILSCLTTIVSASMSCRGLLLSPWVLHEYSPLARSSRIDILTSCAKSIGSRILPPFSASILHKVAMMHLVSFDSFCVSSQFRLSWLSNMSNDLRVIFIKQAVLKIHAKIPKYLWDKNYITYMYFLCVCEGTRVCSLYAYMPAYYFYLHTSVHIFGTICVRGFI